MSPLEIQDFAGDTLIVQEVNYPNNVKMVSLNTSEFEKNVLQNISQATELRDYLNTILNQDK